MANRQWRSERDQDRRWNENQQRGQNFGGSRREQNFNEYNRGQDFSGGYSTQSSGAGRGYDQYGQGNRESFGRQSNSRDFNRDFTRGGNYGQNYSSEFNRDIGSYFGRRENFGNRQWGGRRDFGEADDRQGRYDVGRDFMTNQPIREPYGRMDDDAREFDQNQFGQNWGERDFGRRSSRDYGREFRYAEPNRDFAERGGYFGASYGNYGRGQDFDTMRTEFDESIAGRPYWGRNYEREGWRGYGSRPGNMGFGDRERPDDWNRRAYGYNRDIGDWRFNRGRDWGQDWNRGDYTGAGYYRRDWDREDRGESFGDKVKNFFGIGPKGWRRSDEKIRDDVSERLEEHPDIDASNIEVTVMEGEVTLTGMVDNRWAKRLAEDVANDVRGVKDVHNQIRVQQVGTSGDIGRTRELSATGGTGQTSTATTTRKGTEKAA